MNVGNSLFYFLHVLNFTRLCVAWHTFFFCIYIDMNNTVFSSSTNNNNIECAVLMWVFNTTVSFSSLLICLSLSYCFAPLSFTSHIKFCALSHILLSYLLNIFWRICASCHSPLIRFLICERHVVKFFSVWLMFFFVADDAYSLSSFLHFHNANFFLLLLLYSHTFQRWKGHSHCFRSHSLTHVIATSRLLYVREFPFWELLVCL